MNSILLRDLQNITSADFIPWEELKDRTIFVTGATGLIGYNLICALLYADEIKKLNLKVYALVRDEDAARERFNDFTDCGALHFVAGNVENLPDLKGVDYIVHGASATSSRAFVQSPVETIKTAVLGTINVLELARENNVKGLVYLSSMEVYGHPERGHKVREEDKCALSPLEVRNSYPVSKLQCESLMRAYAAEYGLRAVVARLTQTFGVGVNENDGRLFAYLGRCVKDGQDITLKTRGETERSYLYTADAVTGILTLLLKGEGGRAYNVADEGTYCSVAQMSEIIAKNNGIGVRYEPEDINISGYLDTIYMDLDTSALKELGWSVLSKQDGNAVNCMIRDMISAWN